MPKDEQINFRISSKLKEDLETFQDHNKDKYDSVTMVITRAIEEKIYSAQKEEEEELRFLKMLERPTVRERCRELLAEVPRQ